MRTAILTGLSAAVAAAAIAGPAQAQTITQAPAQAAAPAITQFGKCTVRHSNEYKPGFTYADCEITVKNLPAGQAIKIDYKSNLKTYTPRKAEFGPWGKQSGSIGLADGEIRGLQLAFPNKTAAQVKKSLKITLSSPAAGVTGTVLTA
jgi:ABC-type amino acid transport substrate-binding protein